MENGFAQAEAISSASDDILIQAARDGNVDAFGTLFDRNKDAVYRFVLKSIQRREDAEDIVQEVFCRAWRAMPRFRGDSKLLTWLCRIAANLCADHGRSAHRRPTSATEVGLEPGEIDCPDDSNAGVESQSITRHAVNEALEKLNVNHRMLVVLCDIQGFTHAEAAQVMGCSAISVRVRLYRARRKLRSLLAGVLDEVK